MQSYSFPTTIVPIASLNGGTLGSVKATDIYPAVDVTDITQSPQGTTNPYQISDLMGFLLKSFGLYVYTPVMAATTVNLIATYTAGSIPASPGVGATLTNAGALTAFTIDGEAGVLDSYYLIKNQTNPVQNGIYTLTTVGDNVSIPWVLTRNINFNQPSNIIDSGVVYVLYGMSLQSTLYQVSFAGTMVVGTTLIEFSVYSIAFNGSVDIGTINELAYYAANGDTVSGLPTVNNAILGTNGTGVPAMTQTLPMAVQANITKLGTQLQALNMGTLGINDLATPSLSTDAATKGYVDSTVQPLNASLTSIGSLTSAANELLYATGLNTYTLLSSVANSILSTNVSGVPGWITTLPSGLTIPGFKLTNTILDVNGSNLIGIGISSSAVNYLQISNGSTGNGPIVSAIGSDTNIALHLTGQGTYGTATQTPTTGGFPVIGFRGYHTATAIAAVTITTTATPQNIQSLSLAAGCWEIVCFPFIVAPNLTTDIIASLSTTTATLSGANGNTNYNEWAISSAISLTGQLFLRLDLASTTTVYLVAQATFTGTAPTYSASIVATQV